MRLLLIAQMRERLKATRKLTLAKTAPKASLNTSNRAQGHERRRSGNPALPFAFLVWATGHNRCLAGRGTAGNFVALDCRWQRKSVGTASPGQSQAGKETHEATLQRRDFSDTDARQFYLVDHTTTQSTTTGSGTTILHVVRESDPMPSSPMRSIDSKHPEVTQKRTDETRTAPDKAEVGNRQRTYCRRPDRYSSCLPDNSNRSQWQRAPNLHSCSIDTRSAGRKQPTQSHLQRKRFRRRPPAPAEETANTGNGKNHRTPASGPEIRDLHPGRAARSSALSKKLLPRGAGSTPILTTRVYPSHRCYSRNLLVLTSVIWRLAPARGTLSTS
jgi:hypothetical protein